VALPVGYLLQLSTKPVTTRATTATRTGCVRRGLGDDMSFSVRGSRNAADDDPRLNILQPNIEGLIANKIFVTEQLQAYKNKVFSIILQETHRTSLYKLVIPNFHQLGQSLAGIMALPH